MKSHRLFALLAGVAAASGALAQPVSPGSNDDPIIVTGKRDGGKLLSVDFQRVARQCSECKRVLAEIRKRSAPYQVKKGQLARDREATFHPKNGSIAQHVKGHSDRGPIVAVPADATFMDPYASQRQDTRAGRLVTQMQESFRKDQVDLATVRRDTSDLVAHFLAQLEPYVVKAAEEERVQRKASAVIKLENRTTPARARDVTDAIIRRLDAQKLAFVLPPAEVDTAVR